MQKILTSRFLFGDLIAALMLTVIAAASTVAHAEPNDSANYQDSWFAAARAGRTDILDAMIVANFPIDATTAEGYTALTLSAYNHAPAALNLLMQRGADACIRDKRGNTALMGALFKGDGDIAKILLTTSCDIDQVNNAGQTAVAFATLFGRLDMLPALLARGADLNHLDANGRTPLALATEQRNTQAADVLRQLGAR